MQSAVEGVGVWTASRAGLCPWHEDPSTCFSSHMLHGTPPACLPLALWLLCPCLGSHLGWPTRPPQKEFVPGFTVGVHR